VGETLSTVQELIDESGPIDVTWIYEQWRDELAKLMAKINERFELKQDPSTNGLEVEGEIGSGIHGQVQCFAGPEIDWLVYSWMADPKGGFANLHITISPGPQTDIPFFGMAFANFGARPWAYIDHLPRRDLCTNTDYHFKYFESQNEEWLETRRNNPQLDWFTSPMAYIRAVTSPTAFCYSGPMTQETVDIIMAQANQKLDLWLSWWDNADAVPADEQPALLQHTIDMRSRIAELDPANSVGERLFGKEIVDKLVVALTGSQRVLPHAGA
jgi:hypothetical protein